MKLHPNPIRQRGIPISDAEAAVRAEPRALSEHQSPQEMSF